MCGFAGFIDFEKELDQPERVLTDMADTLVHRGPDDQGIWCDRDSGIGLAHRRLSIVDLSSEGHQPMISHCGRYVIAYNGEIYNFQDIRRELDVGQREIAWRGGSDTEVALEAISYWGLEKALRKFNGMFAFALWDKSEHKLYLARDRFGEKPLYYGLVGNHLLFGSELKSFRVHPMFRAEIDRNSVALLMRYCYIPAPHSIYANIYKLMPASFMAISTDGRQTAEFYKNAPRAYWLPQDIAENGSSSHLNCSLEDAINKLDTILSEAVALRMVADVPLGAFLSGGIDSSIVVAMMQKQSNQPVRTFSIGNDIDGYNEATYAKKVARHIGTEHTELYVTSKEALTTIPKLPYIYDEPFADSSQIPTTLLSQLTRAHVTVSLSGDGGDELFGGYNRYFFGRNIWNYWSRFPRPARIAVGRLLQVVPPGAIDRIFRLMANKLPGNLKRQEPPGRALEKIAAIIMAESPDEMYQALSSTWKNPEALVIDSKEASTAITNKPDWPELCDSADRMMYMDVITYLPDDILTKVDRASMSASLETRVPFLDPHLMEFAWRLPLEWKIRSGEGKWILRQLLYRYVPRELVERPKIGFGVPMGAWLRGPLRDWAESLIEKQRLLDEGFFNVSMVRKCWHQHLTGRSYSQAKLWNILMFQSWLEAHR